MSWLPNPPLRPPPFREACWHALLIGNGQGCTTTCRPPQSAGERAPKQHACQCQNTLGTSTSPPPSPARALLPGRCAPLRVTRACH